MKERQRLRSVFAFISHLFATKKTVCASGHQLSFPDGVPKAPPWLLFRIRELRQRLPCSAAAEHSAKPRPPFAIAVWSVNGATAARPEASIRHPARQACLFSPKSDVPRRRCHRDLGVVAELILAYFDFLSFFTVNCHAIFHCYITIAASWLFFLHIYWPRLGFF